MAVRKQFNGLILDIVHKFCHCAPENLPLSLSHIQIEGGLSVEKFNSRLVEPKSRKKEWRLFFLALPFIVFTLIFSYVPLVGWSYAFIDFQLGLSPLKSKFTGLYYFSLLFRSASRLPRVLRNTLMFNFLGYLTSWMPMALAILLSEIKSIKFKKLVQTTTTIPNFISWVLVFGVAFAMVSNDGVINIWLIRLGLLDKPANPLSNGSIVWYFQTALGLWKGIGFGSIIYLAAISSIDTELYDAARVDGANRMRCVWHITVPGLLPTYLVLLILSISSLFASGFDQQYVFNNPLVFNKMENLAMYTYDLFKNADYSYGIAVGMLQSLVGIIMLFIANNVAKMIRGYKLF